MTMSPLTPQSSPTAPPVPTFLAAGGEMGRRIAALDATPTLLGPLAGWSTTLRTAMGICLASRHPMVIWWGPELVLLYNDAWMPILGPAKHPALGLPGAQVWPETWHIIGDQLAGVLRTGEATWSDDRLLPVDRFGYLEEAYFTYSYSPIHDEDGGVAGVFTAVTETTSRVLGERRLRTLRDLGNLGDLGDLGASSLDQACSRSLAALASHRADIPFAAVYLLGPDGAAARLVATEGLRPGAAPESLPPTDPAGRLIRQAATQGRTVVSEGLAARRPGVALPGHSPVGDADVDVALAIPLADAARDHDGPFGVLVLGTSPYRALDADYRSFLHLVADQVSTALTDAAAAEAERRRTDALVELDRAKTAFFTGVSHELRTPLTLIEGPALDALADLAEPLPPGQRRRVELIRRNSGRLRRVVDTLLDFARLEDGRLVAERVAVDLAVLTRGIAESFAPAAHRVGLGFVLDCPDLPDGVLVDPDMWEKIVLNLLSNAVKYTLEGRVELRLRRAEDGTTELTVSDTGIGIPDTDRDRVFDRFHRVRGRPGRSIDGTGIGLALVAELVGLHDGEVSVRSAVGRGSEFTVRLPASAATDEPLRGAVAVSSIGLYLDEAFTWEDDGTRSDGADGADGADAAQAPRARGATDIGATAGATVLVAEDNPDLRRFVAGLLAPHYTVRLAADGEAALDIVRRQHVDLVLADVMMPRLGGFGLLTRLRAHPSTAQVPVVLLSARAGEEAAIEGLDAGADDYLTKPFSSHDLLARVRSNLEMARLRSQEATWRTAMLDALQDGFYVIDVASSAIVEINTAMTELLGLRPEDLPCGPPYPIFPTEQEDPAELALLQATYARSMTHDHGEVVVPLRHVTTRERVWVSVSYSALADREGGRIYVATMRDVTAQRRATEREALLAETGRLLSEPAGLVDRLTRAVRLAAPVLGDLTVVSLRGQDGRLAPVAAATPRLRPEIAEEHLRQPPRAVPEELGRRYRSGHAFTGPSEELVVPLVVAGRLLGELRLVGTTGGRAEPDVALAEELARRIAAAVETDRVTTREEHLQSVTAALASAGTLVDAARALVAGVRQALAAAEVSVYAVDPEGQHLRLVHRAGLPTPAGSTDREEVLRLDAALPLAQAARTRTAVWLADRADQLARFPGLAGPPAGHDAVAAVPIVAGDRVAGVLTAGFATAREFAADERDFAVTLAGQAGQAFGRAALADQRWQLARTLQHALLPAALPALARLPLAAHYLPAMRELKAGGDWYDVFALDDTRVAMVVGDVVGHGPAAAAVMGQLRSILSTYLHDGRCPAEALEGLDRAARRIPGSRGSTALCLTLDTATGEVCWSGAGHVPPLFVGPGVARFGSGGEGTLLGLTGRPPFVQTRETVEPGTTIALYTDGLVERRGEVVDDGLDRLAATAARLHHHAPDVLAQELLEATLGSSDTTDDIALVLARLAPPPIEERLPSDPTLLPGLRHRTRAWSAAAGLSPDCADDLELTLSEAATNCVEHAYRDGGPGEFVWRLSREADGGVQVQVQDFGRWRPPATDPGYRGRGLDVIHSLGERVELRPSAQGTTVSYRIPSTAEPLARRSPATPVAAGWWMRADR